MLDFARMYTKRYLRGAEHVIYKDGLGAERMAFKATGEHTEKNKTGKISLFVRGAVSRCCIHDFRDVDYSFSFFKEVRMAYYTRFLI